MRLLTTFGLVIASFFISLANASIYDVASYKSPKVQSSDTGDCSIGGRMESESCVSRVMSTGSYPDRGCDGYTTAYMLNTKSPDGKSFQLQYMKDYCQGSGRTGNATSTLVGYWSYVGPSNTTSCPPDESPLYNHEYDSNGDGKIDLCFNPSELIDLSDCSSAPDFLANSSGQTGDICMTQSEGQQCGYIAGSNGSMVKSSSVSCYEPLTPVDDFGGDLLPDIPTNQCLPFGSGFACSAKPDEVCYGGVCPTNCGSVNGQFVCFNEEPKLPDPTNPTDPSNPLDPTIGDPANPDPVAPNDPTNALSNDIATTNNRLGDLIQLTRNKGNDVIYAINKQTGDVVGSIGQTNQSLDSIKQMLSQQNSSGELVAAVDRNTGEVISVMRESQVKLAQLGDNILLTKDIQQGVLTATNETKDEIVRGFDNVIEFMKSVDTPDPETGESDMDRLLKTNSDGFAEVQRLMDDLLNSPGILAPGGGSGTDPTDPTEPEEQAPNPTDYVFDKAAAQQQMSTAFDTTQVDADILLIKQNLGDTFKQLNGSFKDTFSVSVSSNAGLPSLGVIKFDGGQRDVSLEPYSEQMNMIGLALLFMTTVSCLIIIFK
tara:strand:- start:13856 stop:15652 length:1797 start_codon:yes stop_codon:yes gene_type:complete